MIFNLKYSVILICVVFKECVKTSTSIVFKIKSGGNLKVNFRKFVFCEH